MGWRGGGCEVVDAGLSNSISPKLQQQLKRGNRNPGNSFLASSYVGRGHKNDVQALGDQLSHLLLQVVEVGRFRSGKLEQGRTGSRCRNVSLVSRHRPAATLRHSVHKQTQCALYKGSSKLRSPGSCWEGMWHVKWNLLLMQTSGLRFLAAVTQASPRGPVAG